MREFCRVSFITMKVAYMITNNDSGMEEGSGPVEAKVKVEGERGTEPRV